MAKRILVPLDGSARDAELLDAARSVARAMDARLVLLHVAPPVTGMDEALADHQRLHELAGQLRAEGLDAEYAVEQGQPAREIAASADRQRADLVLLAPRHRGLLAALRHPRTTPAMLSHATAPLLIVPEAVGPDAPPVLAGLGAQVIVPLDGSALAEQALPVGVTFARAFSRPLLLVRVVLTQFVAGGVEAVRLQRELQQDEAAKARAYLAETRQRLFERDGLHAQTMELTGEPAERLVRLSGDHPGSLIVMSTRGRGGLARAVLGSVSAEVIRRSAVPVVVVPPSHEAETETPPAEQPERQEGTATGTTAGEIGM
ncbi:MAG TPA: universal stress protein [Ktedonobacterales bacterium]